MRGNSNIKTDHESSSSPIFVTCSPFHSTIDQFACENMLEKMQHPTKANEHLPAGDDTTTTMGNSANVEDVSLKVHFRTWIVVAVSDFSSR